MKPFQVLLLVVILTVALSFVIREVWPKTVLSEHFDTNYVDKIVYVKVEKIVYRHLPAHLETLFVRQPSANSPHDSLMVFASLDTVIHDSLKAIHDTLGIKYYFPPYNFFSLSAKLSERQATIASEVITKTVEVEKKQFLGGWPERILIFAAGYGTAKILSGNNSTVEYRVGMNFPLTRYPDENSRTRTRPR